MILPFDAHNHVHVGLPLPPSSTEVANIPISTTIAADNDDISQPVTAISQVVQHLSGMAVMSMHPRDYSRIQGLATRDPRIVPSVGVHPWFLHELPDHAWEETTVTNSDFVSADLDATQPCTTDQQQQISSTATTVPRWIAEMDAWLQQYPQTFVGEIGLDKFHFDPITRQLTTPMTRQIQALELQLSLAVRHRRPVSLHCVRAMGPLMECLSRVRRNHGRLPPALYFHAFGGKAATVSQLIKSLEQSRKKKSPTKVFFGFAPVINFDSPKTMEVVQTVGLDRLVLETDHEDPTRVLPSMNRGVHILSEALGVSEQDLIQQTNRNVQELYTLPTF